MLPSSMFDLYWCKPNKCKRLKYAHIQLADEDNIRIKVTKNGILSTCDPFPDIDQTQSMYTIMCESDNIN